MTTPIIAVGYSADLIQVKVSAPRAVKVAYFCDDPS